MTEFTPLRNSCVWLLGHSEGALVAEVAAGKGDGICGLILVSGAGRNAADLLTAQIQANPAYKPILPQALSAIEKLRAGQRVDASTLSAPLQNLFRPAVQGYMVNWCSFDPVAELKRFRRRVIVIQGTEDLQTGMLDAERLASARPGIDLKSIVGMNYVWKIPVGGVASNLASYSGPSLLIAPELTRVITEFVRGRSGK